MALATNGNSGISQAFWRKNAIRAPLQINHTLLIHPTDQTSTLPPVTILR
jgi:hypothetical protein